MQLSDLNPEDRLVFNGRYSALVNGDRKLVVHTTMEEAREAGFEIVPFVPREYRGEKIVVQLKTLRKEFPIEQYEQARTYAHRYGGTIRVQ